MGENLPSCEGEFAQNGGEFAIMKNLLRMGENLPSCEGEFAQNGGEFAII